ncbi:unnamed protein product [Brassica rapa]|uniref:3'(2'),5'-bisphosphate nucleotidase n=1 Tax=Brassica campestris TaxID=3711 RepID=A0A8D9CKY4_BRACM|nr:unnamed protein product [Brassica rapa]
MAYEKELDAAKKAASLAARLCQKVQKALLQSDVQSKSDKSPVTVADYGSQAVVSLLLQRELISEPFSLVAEEDSADLRKEGSQDIIERITKLVNDTLATEDPLKPIDSTLSTDDILRAIDCGTSEGGPNGRHWVLDPIDGTKGFLRGDQYAVALGLLEEGKVVLGVLACPNLPLASIAGNDNKNKNSSSSEEKGCLFYATIGSGTYMQPLDSRSEPVKVHVSSVENPEDASFFESFEGAHSLHDLSSSIANKLGVKAPPVRIDSQAKYGALSRGDGAIYLRFPHKGYREKIWDHVAGAIVVTGNNNIINITIYRICECECNIWFCLWDAEAGGIVTDAGGKALDFSKGKYLDLDTGIIVANEKIMPLLLKAVRDSIAEQENASSL